MGARSRFTRAFITPGPRLARRRVGPRGRSGWEGSPNHRLMLQLRHSSLERFAGALAFAGAGALIWRARQRAVTSVSRRTTTTDTATAVSYRAALFSLQPEHFGLPAGEADARTLGEAKLVVVGELHSMPPCVELQRMTAAAMLQGTPASGQLHIVMEHFNFEQQALLDAYAEGRLSFSQLVSEYTQGSEGHDLEPYEPLLRMGRRGKGAEADADHDGRRVRLHAGFIPREYARIVMRESADAAVRAAHAKGYLADDETLAATDAHYDFFESLLTGRRLHATPRREPTDRFRQMFPAQVIKDAAMAHRVCEVLAPRAADDRALVICGVGHSGYSHGVPERIFAARPELAASCYRVWCLPVDAALDLSSAEAVGHALADAFGPRGASSPAELCLAFAEVTPPPPAADPAADDVDAKAATAAAYNAVGSTAHLGGDAARARHIMTRLAYTPAQIAIAGADAPNFQGVASPHAHVALRPGETVVDLGSGLGIDSFVAADAVGARGRVIGVDLAETEVAHATRRAAARGLAERVRFVTGDIERLPLDEGAADAVISNGAFCLAPDKPRAFAEVYRVLRPGGRFAVATSVLLRPLEAGTWPLCMRMFSELDSLSPIVRAAGFADVAVDTSDMAMQFELPEAAEAEGTAHERAADADAAPAHAQARSARNQVHVGAKEFAHLGELDINAICGRVVITGVKPA